MEHGGDKHGPVRDEALKRAAKSEIRNGRGPHADEWRDPQPPGEDRPAPSAHPDGYPAGGTPYGMDDSDVAERADLARFLGRAAFPADRLGLLRVLAENHAPDAVIDRLASLPPNTMFANLQQVAVALGIGVERSRS